MLVYGNGVSRANERKPSEKNKEFVLRLADAMLRLR